MLKVMVTGGAGFIGSAVCRLFVAELGMSVLNIDKLTYAANLGSLWTIEDDPATRWPGPRTPIPARAVGVLSH